MRLAVYLILIIATQLGTAQVLASDWVEEMPAAAPTIQHQVSSENDSPYPTQDRDAAFVHPAQKPEGGILEGNVSSWGANGYKNNSYLQGRANALMRQPFEIQKPHTQSVPPSVFRGWLEENHHNFALNTSNLAENSLVEVKGTWDNADRTLRAFQIRHTTIRPGRLKDFPLQDVRVIVVNCPGAVPAESLQNVRDFVMQGGYLLATDWSLNNLVERAFPGYLQWNGAKCSRTMVDATVVGAEPALLVGTVPNAYWKLDDGSELARVLRPNAVHVLARSRMLASEDPDRQGILAAEFAFGKGKVLQLVGHFDNNSNLAFVNALPDPAAGIGISLRQALAANFVIQGLSARAY